jgi:hypothetical protein
MGRIALGRLLRMSTLAVLLLLPPVPLEAQGASPAASAGPVIGTGDPRSEGEGPGLRGSPLEIALAIVVIGAVAAGATVLVVRLRSDR